MKQRRQFLKVSALATASLGMSNAVTASALKNTAADAEVGDKYTVIDDAGNKHSITLSEVKELYHSNSIHKRPAHLAQCAYALRFDANSCANFSSQTYRLKNNKVGKVDLLLSVVPNKQGKLGLEAILN